MMFFILCPMLLSFFLTKWPWMVFHSLRFISKLSVIFFFQWHHSLAVLDVSSNSGINDQSMELFSNFGMPKLRSLDLSSTNVTGDGVRCVIPM